MIDLEALESIASDIDSEGWSEYANDIRAAAETIQQLRDVSRWIPVSERLPEEGERIVACGVYKGEVQTVEINYRDTVGFISNIFCWTPLPEPPQELDNE
jgi:hypothetical protein